MDYKSRFTGIGSMAKDFIEINIIIVFNENAPEELAEISFQHTSCELEQDIKVGDVVVLGDRDYVVTAVGDEANHTFRSMGHCTFKFTGNDQVELPGHVELSGEAFPDIKIGDIFEIIFT